MTEIRLRPKSDYMHTASWEQLYILGGHWQSDLEFYAEDLQFLKKVLDKYFMMLMDEQHLGTLQTLMKALENVKKTQIALSEKVTHHLSQIELLMENAFSQDEQEFREDHVMLEEELMKFIHSYKQVKKEVFALADEAMESQKMQHLLTT